MSSIPGFLTTTEAAVIIGVSERQVRHYVAIGQLSSSPLGRRHLFRERDVRRFKKRPPGNPMLRKSLDA